MFTREMAGEQACDVLKLRHLADAQRLRRCQHRLRQIELARQQMLHTAFADNAAAANAAAAPIPREEA